MFFITKLKNKQRRTNMLENGATCFYCKCKLHTTDCNCDILKDNRCKKSFTWDHFVALLNGGNNDKANLVPCCFECNIRKNIMSAKKYFKLINQPFRKPGKSIRNFSRLKYLTEEIDLCPPSN